MGAKQPTGILGLGAYVPDRVMTNEDWTRYVDTSDEWILARTGIRERRIAADDQTTLDLAAPAAERALTDAGVEPAEIDELIVATDTPEVTIPDTSAYLQQRLGLGEIPCFDLAGSGCAGWVLGLDIAQSRAAGGRKVLLVGVELLSRLLDWTDRSTCVLFGDAAGAAVIGARQDAIEIVAVTAGTDGSRADILGREVGGTRRPISREMTERGEHKGVAMNGREVFKEAVKRMSSSSLRVLEMAGKTIDDIALVIPHQANLRIVNAVAKALSLPLDRFVVNIEEYGNTGSASIPLALRQAMDGGRIQEGDEVLLTSFGAGFHWASAVIRF